MTGTTSLVDLKVNIFLAVCCMRWFRLSYISAAQQQPIETGLSFRVGAQFHLVILGMGILGPLQSSNLV